MFWWVIIGIVALLALEEHKAHARSGGPTMSDPDYPMSLWGPILSSRITSAYQKVNYRFAYAWMDNESGGNPCVYGDPPPVGTAADGNPKEIGLGQLYNPDDFAKLKLRVTPSDLRAYCIPGTQRRNRKLTDKEMFDQVDANLAKMSEGVDIANQVVEQYGLAWPDDGPDFWKLAKAHHAYPPLLTTGMANVVKLLGRAPTDWNEYREVLGMDAMTTDPKTGHLVPKHPAWHNALNMCEKCGNATVDRGANS